MVCHSRPSDRSQRMPSVQTFSSLIRIMCGVSLRDKITSVMLRERMGVEAIGVVVKQNRLRWFGHVERKDDCDWVKGCTVLEVDGPKPRGRPKKMWMEDGSCEKGHERDGS